MNSRATHFKSHYACYNCQLHFLANKNAKLQNIGGGGPVAPLSGPTVDWLYCAIDKQNNRVLGK